MTGLTQVRLSGLGGQGIVMAGLLLGEAGVIEGRNVSGSNFYGAQARGSECRSEVIFSENPIDFPQVILADVLVSMSQGTYDRDSGEVREGSGLILYDKGLVTPLEGLNVTQVGFPATDHSVKQLKNQQMANIVLLGALIEITKLVTPRALRKAIGLHIQPRFQALNLKALQLGTTLGRPLNG